MISPPAAGQRGSHAGDRPQRVPAYILAGGRSSRFGSDKARAVVGDLPLLLHVTRAIAEHTSKVTVIAAREGAYQDLGLRTLADLTPSLGPLGGLHTALADLDGDTWLLLLSCDWLGLSPAWIDELLRHRRADVMVVAFRGQNWEPLLALYHRGLLRQVAASAEAGELALWQVVERSPHVALPLPPDWQRAIQVNRPDDLEGMARA